MEQRASIPPGLPRSNPTVSYWQDPPSPISSHRTTSALPSSASIVIIGSGIMGASLAYELLNQPCPPSVLMLEARTACSGATGRNGGHTKCASYRGFIENMRMHGEDEAARIARLEYSCMKAVHAFAREHEIECDSWEGDTVDIIYDEKQWDHAKTAVSEIRRLLGPEDPASQYHFWDEKETEEKFLTKGGKGAVSYEAGSLSPYKFVIGMLQLCLQMQLNLQTETPVLTIKKRERERGQGRWTVKTERGSIEADKLVLATNGYTAHLYPKLQGVIVPLRGHMTVQRPGSAMHEAGLPGSWSFIYHDGYEYMITLPQSSKFPGNIAIGGGLAKAINKGLVEYGTTDDTTIDPVIVKYLQNSTLAYFGSNWGSHDPEDRIRKVWTGIMGTSADGFPLIGQVPEEDGLYIAASFQGLGMVMCLYCARALVQIIRNPNEDELEWFPTTFRITVDRMDHRFNGMI